MTNPPCKILVLEDEPIVAIDIAEELRSYGWTILGPAGTLDKAWSLIENETPQVALLDVNLRGERSFDLAMRLRESGVFVAFLTGYSEKALPKELTDCAVFTKPVDLGALVTAIRQSLSERSRSSAV